MTLRANLNATTAQPNSPTLTEGFGGFIRPTPIERLMGRLMRAPDHDSGDGGSGDGGSSDAGAGDGAGASGDAGDAGAADDAGDDDGSILGSASADAGAGDGEGDGAAADDGSADDSAKADDKADATVPETYELKVTAKDAEGKDVDVEIDTALLEEATPIFKDVGLTNEQANKLAPLAMKVEERVLQRQADEFATTRADWAKQVKADKEIGGANLKETERLAAKALDHFVGPAVTKNDKGEEVRNEFRQLLDDSGLGNHPAMVRFCRAVGSALSEDGTIARSGDGPAVKKSREEALYPDDVPKAKA